ncbi:DUF4198 domain-containing protein [Piscinibacter sp. XHJ-5]|uniref:DUF4198 domain-containing protein n=1 Tax=Piscinibacter sp. XHJ-5 TaxID=3037797 RepID=UPI002452D165|nr:DUF4198 domain-containing protein [Piscinibacter sp. XHJ-5]
MKTLVACGALALASVLPLPVHAHRAWILPSATVLSGNEPWVTVDAAVSTDVFHADHNPMRLDGLIITAPDGARVAAENASTGKFRSSFDLKLLQKGTYKLAVVNDTLSAAYKLNGETRRWRGTAEALAKEVPAEAQELRVTRSQSRGETFVTSGTPSARVLQPTGVALELVPITHPNDLVAGQAATFAFVLDGKPAAGLPVTVIPGGIRYRDRLEDVRLTTDAQGRFTVRWPAAGMYWLNANHGESGMEAAGSAAQPARRASYSATLEVLPP